MGRSLGRFWRQRDSHAALPFRARFFVVVTAKVALVTGVMSLIHPGAWATWLVSVLVVFTARDVAYAVAVERKRRSAMRAGVTRSAH